MDAHKNGCMAFITNSFRPTALVCTFFQLSIWGYSRVIHYGYDEWRHPALVRSDPSSCDLISRTNATDTIDQKPPTVDEVSVKRKKRTKPVYSPPGSSGTYAVPSAVESPAFDPDRYEEQLLSQYPARASSYVSSVAPGVAPVAPSFLSQTEVSGGLENGGYDPFEFHGSPTSQQRVSTPRTAYATVGVLSADAACGSTQVHSALWSLPEKDDVPVGDPIDPFDVMSIEAPAFDPDRYEEQLLAESQSGERSGRI